MRSEVVMERQWLSRRMLFRGTHLKELSDRFARFFSLPSSPEERCFRLSGEGVEGEYRRAFLDNSIEIGWESTRSDREVRLAMHTIGDAYSLYFSLADEFCWSEELSGAEWSIGPDSFVVLRVNEAVESMRLPPGCRSAGVSLAVRAERLERFLGDAPGLGLEAKRGYVGRSFAQTDSVRRVLEELRHCPLCGDLRLLYMEAKALELFSLILEQARSGSSARVRDPLSRTERQALERVKSLIDADVFHPVSIQDLARHGHINECSLKRAFKRVYGLPVHSYIRERRMSAAKELLELGRGVAETAFCVGYGDASSFSRAFRKRFGYSPSGLRA
ncbi:AraC family transcriptional regulator [Fretibacterium sp. OH1220_COT-178]|uniref:AraC family transcriptional regulator n=1 Tax=Fretibacterium sp. OH1220_COT-178 TaxID=2491047 RepID=UPI001F2C1288|nr:AraC family transcriptional regulator [Fretibacterium sp. OH1220_COT-178]